MLISLKKGHFLKKLVDRDRGDDVIMTSLNRVRLYAIIFNHTKFGEDRMRNEGAIVLTSRKCAIFVRNQWSVKPLMTSS